MKLRRPSLPRTGPRTRRVLRRAVPLVLLPLLTFFLYALSGAYQRSKPCRDVVISIEGPAENLFLDIDRIKRQIGVDAYLLGTPLGRLNLHEIEATLMETGYVAQANAATNFRGELQVRLHLKQPVARIQPARGKGFYVDAEGNKMPLSRHFTARTVLVSGPFRPQGGRTGPVQDSLLLRTLPLLRHIGQQPFWQAQLSEVVVNRHGEATLYPQLGDARVRLGSVDEYAPKLRRLFAFYTSVLNKKGWDHYREISLEYPRQIVATRRRAANRS